MAKKKTKIPKTVAGVRVPKVLRQAGPALVEFLHTDAGRMALAAALTAAADALVRNRPSAAAVARAGEATLDAGAEAADRTRDLAGAAAGVVAGAVAEAARHVLPASLVGEDEPKRAGTGRYAHLADERAKPKKKDRERGKHH